MAEARTEEPTPRRRRELLRAGMRPYSPGLSAAVALAATLAVFVVVGGPMLAAFRAVLLEGLGAAASPAPAAAFAFLDSAPLRRLLALTALLVLAPAVAALLSGLIQVGFRITPAALAPRAFRLDPARGFGALFSGRRALDASVALLWSAVFAAAALWVLWPNLRGLLALSGASPAQALASLAAVAMRALWVVVALALLAGAVDLLRRLLAFRAALRMGRHQRRRELRQSEGDPELAARRRALHRERVAALALERASLLLCDPAGLAVALHYDARAEPPEPPRLLMQGRGGLSLELRQRARLLGIPIFEAPALARDLARVPDGQPIAQIHFEAVAAYLCELGPERARHG
ncbi:MAG: EscU/YscU/HrcU family type III secretion system export apparatus switch protein [Myxococcales bacterium]|nr:EscU/YscU/HrcU family type III secretion system export apparatus switch protein [Myxococcales bacterium]